MPFSKGNRAQIAEGNRHPFRVFKLPPNLVTGRIMLPGRLIIPQRKSHIAQLVQAVGHKPAVFGHPGKGIALLGIGPGLLQISLE